MSRPEIIRKSQHQPFKYIEAPKLNPKEYLSFKMIKCKKLNFAVDPVKNNSLEQNKNVTCMFPHFKEKTKRDDFMGLFEGETVYITRATKSEAELAIIYKNGSEKKFRADEIQGFIFGGFSSRFWLMQNFINMQPPSSLSSSMLCWNMISISLKSKKEFINLIVPKEQDMDMLI